MKKVIVFCISTLLLFSLLICERNKYMNTSKPYIINPDNIVSAEFSESTNVNIHKIESNDIEAIINILNTAQYDNEKNDGRMFKMVAPSFVIDIKYKYNDEVNIQLWDNIMYVNQTWYQLDINNIKGIFSEYN